MSDNYRQYNDFVPGFLRGRPRQVIIHCLEKKAVVKSTDDNILTKMLQVESLLFRGLHSIDFGVVTGNPLCTCPD